MRIVLIEDNQMLARAVAQALREEGHSVDWLADGQDGAEFLASEGADLAIVDMNLPRMGGLEVIRGLAASGTDIPVLVLTARDSLDDRVAGLDAGADDYMTKPFEMAELTARIRALGRRRGRRGQMVEPIAGLEFDRAGRRLSGPEGTIDLSRRELALWEALFDSAERVVSKAALCDSIYGTGADVDVNAVEILVSRLRRKIEGGGVQIKSIRGLGYILQVAAR
ncbi:MAG: response regulator transcription factor [Paracoccus sp. (in: a-proteobacteria)]|uniref:response regulator transcription factor n=1 Tax=Paracoccus sp. TaxID=267 RepID=UPI0026E01DB3|nr:response regulator transcription factor [Paracoccus sp. (in: a-proteobacteria)]MDO5614091.1 response regulator transcription factor [Paracoccus sp. (in: a-proteobacteria)]